MTRTVPPGSDNQKDGIPMARTIPPKENPSEDQNPPYNTIDDKSLSPMQAAFVDEFLIDMNGTKAAIRAGYSERSAHVEASKLLTRPKIIRALANARKDLQRRTLITQERVLQEYAKLAFLDPRNFYDKSGQLKKVPDLDGDTAAALAGMNVKSIYGAEGNLEGYLQKIRFSDKKGALDSIARHLGMFVEKHQFVGKDGEPVSFKVVVSDDA